MAINFRNLDIFSKNVILVFIGTTLVSAINLFYQLLLAHRLSPEEFAAFNTLLSILMLVSSPLSTLQTAVAKYSAEFNAREDSQTLRFFLSALLKKAALFSFISFLFFYFFSFYLARKLQIPDECSLNILAALIALAWLMPILLGGLQGLELFRASVAVSSLMAGLKLSFAILLIGLGLGMLGALGAFLIANCIGAGVLLFILKKYITLGAITSERGRSIDFREILAFLFPVALGSFCFIALVNSDMILVKLFFSAQESGLYSLAQMVGKIFLFLPGAVSIVLLPRVSGLNSKKISTYSTLKRALVYCGLSCIIAIIVYNIFPAFILKMLTGKAPWESVILGRFFSLSMSFFSLLFVLITYFFSLKDFRFIKYLFTSCVLQVLAVIYFHHSLVQVQLILCLNAAVLLGTHLRLVRPKAGQGIV